ncbi:restriction endonuclease subunit S, partial [Kaistella sp.]|uniref:restriction endonuclease subunit S n=1 Tax=Kaistella sp. TaxID=2782235 RepID=UPI002F952FBF
MSYRKIGDLIQLVDQRNKDLSITHLVGLTINKKFIPSVANTIGTDMANYKLIKKNQFACSTMQVRRDKKMPIALLKELDIAIISQAYPVFEVIDENVILPDYLMLWFSRSEFDREACFHAVGGVRGSLEWEDFCGMQLPVPSIEEQRQIVAQYQSIANKIKVNEQICEKLEATAQALYKHWFVDFEFPVSNCEEGGTRHEAVPALVAEERSLYATKQKGYKSSGGKMVWNEELGKEIPEGWEVGDFATCLNFKTGKLDSNAAVADGEYPFFTCSEETYKVNSFSFDQEAILLGGNNAIGKFPLKYFQGRFDAYQRTYIIDTKHERISNKQIYYRIKGLLQEMKES